MSSKREKAAYIVAKYQETDSLRVFPEVETSTDGYWVQARIWVPSVAVIEELFQQNLATAEGERDRKREEEWLPG